MVIACPGYTVQFYDATTFKPCKKREALKLQAAVMRISFQPETDTYLLGCRSGPIYKYNISKNELKMLERMDDTVLGITFLDSGFYALSLLDSKKLYIRNLDDETMLEFDLRRYASYGLHYLSKRKLLFAGLENGFVRVYRINKLPHLKVICSVRTKGWTLALQSFTVNGKEYVVTISEDQTVRIWHLLKGKMRLLKVLYNGRGFRSLVYLENYKMIAIAYEPSEISFFRFPSMKLERKVELKKDGLNHLFVMKDKNMIGATNDSEGFIDFIQLHPRGTSSLNGLKEDEEED